MKRFFAFFLLLIATSAAGQNYISGQPCYLSGNVTKCFKPINAASGGTGLASGTSGGIPYFSSTTTIASSGLLTANGIVLGGGAGATPTSTGACTGSNQVLRSGSPPACGSLVSADLPAASSSAAGSVSTEQTTTNTPSFTGPRSASSTTWTYSRVGGSVTIRWNRDVGASCSNNTFVSSAGAVPSAYRPGGQVIVPVFVQDSSVDQSVVGFVQISSAGTITIGKNWTTSAFTGAGNCGYYEGSMSFPSN